MELVVKRSDLLSNLQRAQGIVEKKTTMPILNNVLMETTDNGLKIIATDLEVGIIEECNAEIKRGGSCTVMARKLFEIVRELSEREDIKLSVKENLFEISCGSSIFHLKILPSEDFPSLPRFESLQSINIPSELLQDMIQKTIFSVSTDETRYNLTGVLVEMEERGENHVIRMVSTDGHRLSLCEREIAGGKCLDDLLIREDKEKSDVILPRKGVIEMGRLVEDTEEIEFGIEKNNVIVRKDSISLMMRTIEGNFPDYRSVIPDDMDRIVTVDSQVLAESLRRMSILAAEKSKGVQFHFNKGSLTLSSSNPDLGDAQETIDVNYEGEETQLRFNVRYLLEVLQILKGEVLIEFSGSLRPCLLKSKEDPNYLYVVMPMRM